MLKTACQSIGLASLILLTNIADLFGGGGNVRLHFPLKLTAICLAHVADIAVLSMFLFLVLTLLHRSPLYPAARVLLAILVPPYIVWRTQSLLPFDLPDDFAPILALVWAAVLLILLLRYKPWYRRTMRFASTVAAFFVVFAFLSVAQLMWVACWRPDPQGHGAVWAATAQPPRRHPLLVWVIFDELSYDQVFEHRARDLELPNFDALRAQSTLFTDVQPVAYKTAKVIPSLLSGQAIDDFRYTWNKRLIVKAEGTRGFHPLSGTDTVFGYAHQNGWRTSAVGWYVPYCTLFPDVIDDCYWTNWDKLDGPMALHDSFWRNLQSPLRQLELQTFAPGRADRNLCDFDVRHRYQTHIDLEQHAMNVLSTDQADFVLLHLPIPHSPNIWSRIDEDYIQTCDSSYLDNLALADREMGRILALLQRSPRWKDTTLIVEGDHSWRIDLWNELPAWTDEDDASSRGVFDPRPALLIHTPGQTQPLTNAEAWPLLRIHDVIKGILGHTDPEPQNSATR